MLSAPDMTKKQIKLSGLDCASCALAIETALDRVAGVKTCAVNDRENLLEVEFDEAKVSTFNILEAVRDAGFEAEEA